MKKILLTTGILLLASSYAIDNSGIIGGSSGFQPNININSHTNIMNGGPLGGLQMGTSDLQPNNTQLILIKSNGELWTNGTNTNITTDIVNVNKFEKEYNQSIYTNSLQKEKRSFLSKQNPENNITDLRTKKSKKTKITVNENI